LIDSEASIGVYGGSFDPVHFGHLRSALEVKQQLDLDQLRFMPAGTPPHREGPKVSSEHRIAMLKLAIEDSPGITIDPREINQTKTSYTYDTLRSIQEESPTAAITLVIGTDQFSVFDTWHRWPELLSSFYLAVVKRPGEALSAVAQEILRGETADRVTLCEGTQMDISSTRIRTDLKQGMDIQFLLPYKVREYIFKNKLYN